ncbi:MAG TPA: hypothetical protein VJ866_23835 [Pyrinomonadaceae bacterium]|nr:hypothetical protein [Pyrinomonadaceae bacterium]
MKKLIPLVLLTFISVSLPPAAAVQKKQAECTQAPKTERNWDLLGQEYVYWDYVLCPADIDPPSPLVRVWLTTSGDGFAVEKWTQTRDGADSVSVFHGKKKAFTLYHDLAAVPLKVFKAERRSAVPTEMAAQPFMLEGTTLVPLENLEHESAEKAKKVFESADVLVRQAERKMSLLRESSRVAAVVDSLKNPLKVQK